MARVTGIGGVFFKSTSDPKRLAAWYQDNLGMALEEWGRCDPVRGWHRLRGCESIDSSL